MNREIEIGKINSLRIDRFTEPGAYLMAEDEEDVLLPNCYVNDDMFIDDVIDVFIYTDSEDRIVATTLKPKAMLGEIGLFEIVGVESFGAFADWGLSKDLFIPLSLQKKPFAVGEKRVLIVSLDEKRNMLVGNEKVGRFFNYEPKDLDYKDEVDCFVLAKTPLGVKVVVNNKFEGMIFDNEIYEDLKVGDVKKGFIKKIREDGKIDISLREVGKNRDLSTVEIIKKMLKEKGKLPYTYKSDPETIKEVFKTSRKSFKRSLTELINSDTIELLEDGIKLK